MKNAGKDANILVTSSILGTLPKSSVGVYGMTKAALNNMVQWLSHELMDDGIRVNAVGPGLTKTNMTKPEFDLGIEDFFPAKSLGKPEEIASVIAMICSKDGSFVNGETYNLTGGFPNL